MTGGYAALNPYYFLFSAALLRPGYLPACLGFATTRTETMEVRTVGCYTTHTMTHNNTHLVLHNMEWQFGVQVGLALGRLSWLIFGPARMKRFLANTLAPP